jgi:hypothetical protein
VVIQQCLHERTSGVPGVIEDSEEGEYGEAFFNNEVEVLFLKPCDETDETFGRPGLICSHSCRTMNWILVMHLSAKERVITLI